MPSDVLEKIQSDYLIHSGRLNKLSEEVFRNLNFLIEENSIALALPIQKRVKSLDSILDKHKNGRFKIKASILELQDLVGLRIITLFRRDLTRVEELVASNFNIIVKYDTQTRLKDDQFGYNSSHYIIQIPNEWRKVPIYHNLENIMVEVQIRTISQHAWASISQTLEYKKESNVPMPLRRTLSRASALLETVDYEFERLLKERDEYISQPLDDLKKDEELNTNSLEIILNSKLPAENKGDEKYSELLEDLITLELNTKARIIDLIDTHLAEALIDDKRIVQEIQKNLAETNDPTSSDGYTIGEKDMGRLEKGVFLVHGGLVRVMAGKKFNTQNINEVLELKRRKVK